MLYPLWVVDSFRTLKVHHYLFMVTIGTSLFVLGYHLLPIATIDLMGDNSESKV